MHRRDRKINRHVVDAVRLTSLNMLLMGESSEVHYTRDGEAVYEGLWAHCRFIARGRRNEKSKRAGHVGVPRRLTRARADVESARFSARRRGGKAGGPMGARLSHHHGCHNPPVGQSRLSSCPRQSPCQACVWAILRFEIEIASRARPRAYAAL